MKKTGSFNAKEKFESIYGENEWGQGSGEGSLPENTKKYRDFIKKFLKKYKIKSVLDLGSGDWQIASLINWDGINYTGVDVVKSLIDKNNSLYGSKNIKFIQGDISNCNLPTAELIIIKDVLQHWPTDVIQRFLPRLKAFKYALIINDNYPDKTLNKDPDPDYGHFRPVAILEEPFNLESAKVIYTFRTDPKMPEGFNNKEVILMTNTEETIKENRDLLKKIPDENINKGISKHQVDIATDKAIRSLDEVIGSLSGGPGAIKDYFHTVGVHNLRGNSAKSKLARKSLSPLGKVTKKMFEGYFQQRTEVDNYIRDMLYINNIEQQRLFFELEQNLKQTHHLIDGFKKEIHAELAELHGGVSDKNKKIKSKIINAKRVNRLNKVNIGCGTDIKNDYINIDNRAIEGVDVVADLLDMPFKQGSLNEVFASHVAEHFIERDFKKILQYWFSLLKKGGSIRLIVPNIEAMARRYAENSGEVSWFQLRAVALGGQDYASDYHFNHFSALSMKQLVQDTLGDAADYTIVDSERRNGECLELEVLITKQ